MDQIVAYPVGTDVLIYDTETWITNVRRNHDDPSHHHYLTAHYKQWFWHCELTPINGSRTPEPSMLATTLSEPPSLNRTYKPKRGGGIYKTEDAKAWQNEVMLRARLDMVGEPIVGKVGFKIDYYPGRSNRDIDNNLKLLFDALEGIAYANDKQVCRLIMEKHDTDTKDPRLEIIVWKL